MPLGILTDEEFAQEIEQIPIPAEVINQPLGRGSVEEKPESLRKIISEEAINGAPASEIAKAFDVSPSSISAYKNGATSTASYDSPSPSLTNHNNGIRDRIINRANGKIMTALKSLTSEKINDAKARDIASIAKDMSVVVKNMTPEQSNGPQNNVQFVLFAPRMKQEDEFAAITVRE